MAQADSVPSASRPPFTGAGSNTFTKPRFEGLLYSYATPVILSIDDLINRLVLGHDQTTLIKRWREIGALSENSTQNPNTRWLYLITGRIPVGSYAVAVCYATADHERAKGELKALMPEDAKEAIGHGVRARRSKSGAVSFDLIEAEPSRAAV
jgi:hypothetical protein